MIEISIFVKGEFRCRMDRSIVPRVGETIIIDCGDSVIVTEVIHQWDSPYFVQIDAKTVVEV